MRLAFAPLAVAVAAAALALAACPANHPPSPPPLRPDPAYAPPDAGAVTPIAQIDAAPAPGAPGAACMAAEECASGVCEGLGCGADAPGRCTDKTRMCTMDMIDYCGCDGKTFQSSGSCPGRRYAKRGGCGTEAGGPSPGPPPPPPRKKGGEACLSGDECETAICEGQGCGDDAPGHCATATVKCTRDVRPYCGCDGKTFQTSGTCPGRRFSHRGKC